MRTHAHTYYTPPHACIHTCTHILHTYTHIPHTLTHACIHTYYIYTHTPHTHMHIQYYMHTNIHTPHMHTCTYTYYTYKRTHTNTASITGLSQGQEWVLVGRSISCNRLWPIAIRRFCRGIDCKNTPLTHGKIRPFFASSPTMVIIPTEPPTPTASISHCGGPSSQEPADTVPAFLSW